MNKKNILCAMAAMALAVTFTSCDKSNKMDEKGAAAAAAAEKSGAQLIAFVEIDSLQEKYEFCKEMKGKLEQKQKNAEAALASQEKNLQAAAQNFQNKINNNGFSSRQEAENQQAAIQRQQDQYMASQQRLGNELQSELVKYQEALLDSINHFLAEYNKDKKFAFILTKQKGDNILYADQVYDITDDVVAGLNKAYKGSDAKAAPAKAEEKAPAKADEKAPEAAEAKTEDKK